MFEDWMFGGGFVLILHGEKDAGDRIEFDRARPYAENVGREKA
jgi:hypothetical protein